MLLNYSHHTSPTGLSDVLDKLATFAAAQGWTTELQTNKVWADSGGWGWQSGSNDFLELVSNGYGDQDLQFRFFQEYVDSTEDKLTYAAIEPGAGAYTAISTPPYEQDQWNTSQGYQIVWDAMSCPNATTPDVWFVGNDKFIAVHWQSTAFSVQSFAFGTIDLIPEMQDRTDLQFFWGGCAYHSTQSYRLWSDPTGESGNNLLYWFNPYGRQLFVIGYDGIKWVYYDGAARALDTVVKANLRYDLAAYDYDPGTPQGGMIEYNVYPNCCVYNSFTQKRVLMRPTIFTENPDLTGTFIAAGHLPVYFLNVEGLVPGDIIEMGEEEYICFPAFLTNNEYGVAYRIV